MGRTPTKTVVRNCVECENPLGHGRRRSGRTSTLSLPSFGYKWFSHVVGRWKCTESVDGDRRRGPNTRTRQYWFTVLQSFQSSIHPSQGKEYGIRSCLRDLFGYSYSFTHGTVPRVFVVILIRNLPFPVSGSCLLKTQDQDRVGDWTTFQRPLGKLGRSSWTCTSEPNST